MLPQNKLDKFVHYDDNCFQTELQSKDRKFKPCSLLLGMRATNINNKYYQNENYQKVLPKLFGSVAERVKASFLRRP